MKTLLSLALLLSTQFLSAQQLDTLAIQDFETVPMSPVWNYSGTLADVQSGYATAGSCIPNTPLGLNGSQAWHVVSVSGGNPIVFNNTPIPAGYDSIRVHFNLAALNLSGATGGPDDLDYVLVEYSLDNGATYVGRLRIRGAIANNSFWAYDATGVAAVPYLPATEALFQPVTSGLQVAEGYSYCEISFPGSITQLTMRITPRSSSSTDSWLIDNLVLIGEMNCSPSASSLTTTVCDSYTAPSGSIYTTSGNYVDVIPNAAGCDSTISIALTVNNSATSSDVITACGSYTWIDGNTYTADNNTATFLSSTVAGCDSTIQLNLYILALPDNSVSQNGTTLTADQVGATYQWIDCDNNTAIAGETGQTYTPLLTGNYAVEVTLNACTSTSSCFLVDYTGVDELTLDKKELVKIVDLMGRETEFKPNTPLILIYSDGTAVRVMEMKD